MRQMSNERFEYRCINATPIVTTVLTQQADDIEKLSGWNLLKDGE